MAAPAQPAASPKPQPKHMGVDVTRPFRYAASGIKGVFTGFLDGMAKFGRKGFWAGIGVGILAAVALGAGVGTVLLAGVGGLAIAGSIGAVGGALYGGVSNIRRSERREKYADELAERQTARSARAVQSGPAYTHRDTLAVSQNATNYNFERAMQQERENDRDERHYWQDRVDHSHGGQGRGF